MLPTSTWRPWKPVAIKKNSTENPVHYIGGWKNCAFFYYLMMNIPHLVKPSPWPLFLGVICLSVVSSAVIWFKYSIFLPLLRTFIILILTTFVWWRDISLEGGRGAYSSRVVDNLKLGIVLFIFSEVCFFGAFFWAFFHSSVFPAMATGRIWPPSLVASFNPVSVPLLNTLVLLSRGLRVTWAHHFSSSCNVARTRLAITLILGTYFTALQITEYKIASFTILSNVGTRLVEECVSFQYIQN